MESPAAWKFKLWHYNFSSGADDCSFRGFKIGGVKHNERSSICATLACLSFAEAAIDTGALRVKANVIRPIVLKTPAKSTGVKLLRTVAANST